MDRNSARNNLEALAEEDDEEEGEDNETDEESDSESEDDEGSGAYRGEPNKFDGLCDGLLNAMALVHSAMQDLLEFKDELLKHALPPTVLIHLAMNTSKLFRSISDLNMPVNELVRLVRVYSTPWEEKSAALKKLHEDYENKQRQLNIAIKRLQLVDAHSKRIAREKRIMNWEKLFAKMTSSKGHGRRWKFLIETIKQKAKMGLEHVQAYTQALEESSESEDDNILMKGPATLSEVGEVISENQEEEFEDGNESQEHNASSGGWEEEEEKEEEEEEEREEEENESVTEQSYPKMVSYQIPSVTIHITPEAEWVGDGRAGSPKKVRFEEESVHFVKPPSKAVETWTGEPEYDRSLFIRIFCPEGLEKTELRCTVTCDGHIFKTGILDAEEDGEKEEEIEPTKRPKAAQTGKRITPEGTAQQPISGKNTKPSKRFKEFELKLPEEVSPGLLKFGKTKPEPTSLQIAVYHGPFEELFAMATLDFQDIKELNLKTVYLPPPRGDDDILRARSPTSLSDMGDADSLNESIDLILPDEKSEAQLPVEDLAKDIDVLPFPLYSLHPGKSDGLKKPCGTLPLVLYWGKKERPCVFNRQIGTMSVYDLVFEMTGIDLMTTSKEDLHKETIDRSVSVMPVTPVEEEEKVLKAEYDQLQAQHQTELQYIQEEYEKRLEELMISLQAVQEENVSLVLQQQQQQQQQQTTRPLSSGSRGSHVTRSSSTTPAPAFTTPKKTPLSAHSLSREKTVSDINVEPEQSLPDTAGSRIRSVPPKTQRSQRNFRIGRPLPKWGENLPQDFFERLRLFEEESKQHKQELSERYLREIKEDLEKKLAGQHKLSKREEQMYDVLKDVCLPALFMPVKTGNVFNPRAHQYFHPTGSTDLRLTQPPSVFQLPPLANNKTSVVNLFELSKNFHSRGPDWLVQRYIQQQEPTSPNHMYPQTPVPPSSVQHQTSPQHSSPFGYRSRLAEPAMDGSQSAHGSMPEQEVEA